MHVILLFITIIIATPLDWVDALDTQIDTVNKEAVLKKTQLGQDATGWIRKSRYKLDQREKLEIEIVGGWVDSVNTRYYSEGNELFAMHTFLIADYLHKGNYNEERPEGEITETRKYYTNEQQGIQLERSIDYFQNSNRDSLQMQLQQQPFDTLLLTKEDYRKDVKAWKRLKKGW